MDSENGELISDKKFVLDAIYKNPFEVASILSCASPEILNDKEIILRALSNIRVSPSEILKLTEIKDFDRKTILGAVKRDGKALQFAPENFKNDRDIVLEAVRNNGWAFEYASEALKNDRDIVLEVVRNNGGALKYASEALRNDVQFLLELKKEGVELSESKGISRETLEKIKGLIKEEK